MNEIKFYPRDSILRDQPIYDDYYDVGLKIGQLQQLEESTNEAATRLWGLYQTLNVKSVVTFEVLRQGLMGGGMDPLEARKKATLFMNEGNILRLTATAGEIIAAALIGGNEEPVKDGLSNAKDHDVKKKLNGENTTASEGSSVSQRKKSKE